MYIGSPVLLPFSTPNWDCVSPILLLGVPYGRLFARILLCVKGRGVFFREDLFGCQCPAHRQCLLRFPFTVLPESSLLLESFPTSAFNSPFPASAPLLPRPPVSGPEDFFPTTSFGQGWPWPGEPCSFFFILLFPYVTEEVPVYCPGSSFS